MRKQILTLAFAAVAGISTAAYAVPTMPTTTGSLTSTTMGTGQALDSSRYNPDLTASADRMETSTTTYTTTVSDNSGPANSRTTRTVTHDVSSDD